MKKTALTLFIICYGDVQVIQKIIIVVYIYLLSFEVFFIIIY